MSASKSKYYVRVMRPTYQRAVLTVEATTEDAAIRLALERAERLAEKEWQQIEAVREPPVIEVLLNAAESAGDSEADTLAFVRGVQHAYALLQADLEAGEGAFIAPAWLADQYELLIADVTQDWADALSGVSEAGVDAFQEWLARQKRPNNVVNFLAERDKRNRRAPDLDDDD